MTIEEDSRSILLGVISIAGPIFSIKTFMLWQGIIVGDSAKSQAWIAFSQDPITHISAAACIIALWFLWASAYMFGWFERESPISE